MDEIEEVLMGNVLTANVGQAPGRQAWVYAGGGYGTVCTTVNKVSDSI